MRVGCPSTSLILGTFKVEVARSREVGTVPRGTERSPKCWALSCAADPLPTGCLFKGVVQFAAGNIARVVGKGEGIVKEIHWGGGSSVTWKSCQFKLHSILGKNSFLLLASLYPAGLCVLWGQQYVSHIMWTIWILGQLMRFMCAINNIEQTNCMTWKDMFKRHLCRRREKQANKLASAKGWSAWRTSFAKLDLNGGKWRKWKNLTKLCYICCIVGQCQWYWYSAITITTCCFNPPQKYDNLENAPLQSAVLQASAWTGSPRHCPLPPGSSSAHARFLHRVPWPQEAEHWLHSPHGCQLPGLVGTSLRNLNWEPNTFVPWH